MTPQAEQFRRVNQAYFFTDAHFYVEAEASTKAEEISHNVYQFPDGSILQIDWFTATAYPSKEIFLQANSVRAGKQPRLVLASDL